MQQVQDRARDGVQKTSRFLHVSQKWFSTAFTFATVLRGSWAVLRGAHGDADAEVLLADSDITVSAGGAHHHQGPLPIHIHNAVLVLKDCGGSAVLSNR